MSLYETCQYLSDNFDPDTSSYDYQPNYLEAVRQPETINFGEFSETGSYNYKPTLFNMDGYISPYASNNWNATSNILGYIDDMSRLPAIENKLDPNKIFNSDIAALRAIGADETKIIKLFEKKLIEVLSDKGKYGLTEDDIAAMQALTAARSAVTNIQKEQVNIKKNIADIRIKMNAQNNNTNGNTNSNNTYNSMNDKDAIARSMMDNLFDFKAPDQQSITQYQGAVEVNPVDASNLIDDIMPVTNDTIQYAALDPTTYVVLPVDGPDDSAEFATYAADGSLISGYTNPSAKIIEIDRENHRAMDENNITYPLKDI